MCGRARLSTNVGEGNKGTGSRFAWYVGRLTLLLSYPLAPKISDQSLHIVSRPLSVSIATSGEERWN